MIEGSQKMSVVLWVLRFRSDFSLERNVGPLGLFLKQRQKCQFMLK